MGLGRLLKKELQRQRELLGSIDCGSFYMEKFMQIQSDHVHSESAESIEHIMTKSLETELLKTLGGQRAIRINKISLTKTNV